MFAVKEMGGDGVMVTGGSGPGRPPGGEWRGGREGRTGTGRAQSLKWD